MALAWWPRLYDEPLIPNRKAKSTMRKTVPPATKFRGNNSSITRHSMLSKKGAPKKQQGAQETSLWAQRNPLLFPHSKNTHNDTHTHKTTTKKKKKKNTKKQKNATPPKFSNLAGGQSPLKIDSSIQPPTPRTNAGRPQRYRPHVHFRVCTHGGWTFISPRLAAPRVSKVSPTSLKYPWNFPSRSLS